MGGPLLGSGPSPATALDRLIGWIAPGAGLARLNARQALGRLQTRAYEAAAPQDGWRPRRAGASPDADHMGDAAQVRYKARALVQNVPYMAAAVNAIVDYVIGTGITPNPQDPKLRALWDEWGTVADADGQRDINGLSAAVERAAAVDGEVLWRYRWRQPQDGLPVPLQIQLLEIDYLDTWRQGGAASGNVIVNGIEYDPIGRRVAYWLYDQHPGDVTMRPGSRIISKRVDAGLVGHYYDAARPGQGRGISRLAPVISTARDLQLLLDAEINRKNMEARLGVIASGDMAGAINVPTGSSVDAMSQLRQLGDLPSGGIVQLPPGLSINTIAPNAAPGFPENVKLYLHLISAGVGVPYELMTGDMSEVNFSSARVRRLDFKRANERQQWNNHIPNFLMPVSQAFCTGAVMVNKATRQARIGATEWTTPRIEYVNPAQEVEAAVMAIASGQASISSFIRGRGDDPKTVFAELESDFKALKGAGVLEMLMFMLKGKDFGSSGGGSQASAQGNKP